MRTKRKGCCTPQRHSLGESMAAQTAPITTRACSARTEGMVQVSSGLYTIGYDGPAAWKADGEGPVRKIELKSYWLDEAVVTNAQFATFVESTGYVTESERFGWAYVFKGQLPKSKQRHLKEAHTVRGLQWWYAIEGAYWRKPEGPGANINKRMDHPVVSLSWNDALAYASWAGKRLPTEAEWEVAARGPRNVRSLYPWGDELEPGGKHRCNVWQGNFPEQNTAADGYQWTAPVRAYRKMEGGYYNLLGNVWEWCADWFSPDWHVASNAATRINPQGPPSGETKIMKGGSFLCHESYCNRYRLGARTANTPDSATTNLGFRCAMDAD